MVDQVAYEEWVDRNKQPPQRTSREIWYWCDERGHWGNHSTNDCRRHQQRGALTAPSRDGATMFIVCAEHKDGGNSPLRSQEAAVAFQRGTRQGPKRKE